MNAESWLTEVRALDPELLARLGVDGHTTAEGVEVARFRYFENAEAAANRNAYGAKFRRVDDKKFWFSPKGANRGLYNGHVLEDRTLHDQPIIVTEGEIDCLSVIQAGFVRAVSVPDGWTDGLEGGEGNKIAPLMKAEDRLRESPCVIVAGDLDGPGASMAKAVRNLLEGHQVRWVTWPEGCKDANDVLRKHGKNAIVSAINDARLMDPEGGLVHGFADRPPAPPRQFLRPDYPGLENAICLEIGALSVSTGVPGSGKSTFATFLTHHLIRNHGIRVGAALFETHDDELLHHLSMLNLGRPATGLSSSERSALFDQLDQHWRLIKFDEGSDASQNIGWIERMVHTAAVRDGCKLILIDPWNELDHLPEPGESMTLYINFALTKIRKLAARYDCHVHIIAHPAKLGDRQRNIAPKGYDIADSAAWFNKPSLGWTVHNVEADHGPETQLITWKVKHRQTYGVSPGIRRFEFDERMMVYRPVR